MPLEGFHYARVSTLTRRFSTASPYGSFTLGGRGVFGSDRKERLRFEIAGGPSSACTTLGADTRTGCEHRQGAHRAAVGFGCNERCVSCRGQAFRYLCSRASNSELNRNLCANGYFLRSGHSRACLHARGDGVRTSALVCREYPRRPPLAASRSSTPSRTRDALPCLVSNPPARSTKECVAGSTTAKSTNVEMS
jgi:hypothetical protein